MSYVVDPSYVKFGGLMNQLLLAHVWQDFLSELKKGPLPSSKFRPYHSSLLDILPSVLNNLRDPILACSEDPLQPEWIAVGDQLHFIRTLGPGTSEFCFSFLIENDQWYLQHIETISIRLDQIGPLPASLFPDVPEDTKAWCIDELRVTEMVKLYRYLEDEKGKDFAMNWFCDGESYMLGVRAWVPFLPPSRAFILYICWELANLQNNPVSLLELDDEKAIIRVQLRYLQLYKRAAHLSQLVSETEYFELFDTIWQDRAAHAGWDVKITWEIEDCIFTFTKTSSAVSL